MDFEVHQLAVLTPVRLQNIALPAGMHNARKVNHECANGELGNYLVMWELAEQPRSTFDCPYREMIFGKGD